MNICIYGAASAKLSLGITDKIEAMSEALAKAGHSLIFGGGATGAMGAAARGFSKGGANILGVITDFMGGFELMTDKCTQLITVKTMGERKMLMETASDLFIIAPGGIGTMDEFFEIITMKELGQKDCTVLLLNVDHYYDELDDLLKKLANMGIIQTDLSNLFMTFTDEMELVRYIQKIKK